MSQNSQPRDTHDLSTRSQLNSGSDSGFSVPPDFTVLPQRIDRYIIRSEVGAGGFGRVFKAFDPIIKREVAVKVPKPGIAWSAESEETFLDEARKAAQLCHRNVVAVYDAGKCPVYGVYIVMEFVDGETVAQHLNRQAVDIPTVVRMISQISSAMHHAHQLGLIHRDLKPSNILLDKSGNAHVADFGLALPEERQSAERGIISGTLPYMSPEQVRGESHMLDGRSDLWSLGVILYQCLTGRKPFAGKSAEILREEICHREPRPLRQIDDRIPRRLEEICLKCLSKDVSGRYPTGKDLEEDLLLWISQPDSGREQISGNSGQVVSGPDLVASIRREGQRWSLVATIAALAVSVSAVIVWSFFASPPGSVVSDPVSASDGGSFAGLKFSDQAVGASVSATKEVLVVTRPANARIVVYPVGDPYGFLDGARRVEADNRSPTRLKLLPGVYLVVAVLDDGRFHEVYRHVPERPHSLASSPSAHIFWTTRVDGAIEWPTIEIPRADVADDMGQFDGADVFRVGDSSSTMTPEHSRFVAPFRLDTHEVDWQTYLANNNNQKPPSQHHLEADMSQSDLPVTGIWYHDAVAYAEQMGKRLPSEAEYEFAATRGGRQKFPWGDDPGLMKEWILTPAGTPDFDRVDAGKAVWGLYSNAAEWTCSWASAYPPQLDYEPGLLPRAEGAWIVRGAPFSVFSGNPDSEKLAGGPRQRIAIHEKAIYPLIGFRCARSLRPRMEATDLERFLPE
jgi:serine/threonine protein kinase